MSSEETKPYNELYIKAWTLLSLAASLFLLVALVFGRPIQDTGHWIWDLLRYFALPII